MNDDDLSQAIREASDEGETGSRVSPVSTRQKTVPGWVRVFVLFFVVVFAIPIVMEPLLDYLDGNYTEESKRRIVEDTLQAAINEVEAVKDRTGEYPVTIPNAALGSVVYYRRDGDTFYMRFTDGGYSIARETDGLIHFEETAR